MSTDINRWTINFSLDRNTAHKLSKKSIATFTLQLAAAKSTAGNTDNNQGAWPSFPVRCDRRAGADLPFNANHPLTDQHLRE